MKFGLAELFGNLRIFKGSTYVGFAPPTSVPASYTFTLPSALPSSGTQLVGVDTSGNWVYQNPSAGGGGTVTSVALSAPSVFSVGGSPVTGAGTLALTFATGQAANQFLATPNGANGAVGLRSLAYGDLSALVGTGANTLAAGNDSRFHTQNTDMGTNQSSFQIDSGNSGPRLKNTAGAIRLRNSGDNADADLIVANLTVTGTTTTVNSETVTIDDSIIVLNNNVSSGTPTEDGGIQVRRGSQANAALIWDEANDLWRAGLAGTEVAIARTFRTSFTNATLTSGVLTVNHNLGQQYCEVLIYDNTNKVIIPDEITATNANSASIDLTSFGTLTGTWNVAVIG